MIIVQVSRKEMQATLALRFGGEGILKMKGIPFKASAADVRKFFASFKIKPDGIRWAGQVDSKTGWGMALNNPHLFHCRSAPTILLINFFVFSVHDQFPMHNVQIRKTPKSHPHPPASSASSIRGLNWAWFRRLWRCLNFCPLNCSSSVHKPA